MYFSLSLKEMLVAHLQMMLIKSEGTDASYKVLGFHGNENSYCILLSYVTVLFG
jgi:hypothetical protein